MLKPILILTFIFGLLSCSSQKKLETLSSSFEIAKSSVQEWVGGRPESGSGVKLEIVISKQLDDVTFEEVYFREQLLACKTVADGANFIVLSEYKTTRSTEVDTKEIKSKNKFPFELKASEAVIGFKEGGADIMRYLKVTGIKEKPPLIFSRKSKD